MLPGAEITADPRTAAQLAADELVRAGVRLAFTVPGESFLGLLDALTAAGVRVVAARHEGAAAFMAEAVGQLTGRPSVCLATRAVGAANLAIGIHTARQDSSPLIAVVGQVERGFLGREAFQEIDQVGSIGQLALWAGEAREAADVPRLIREGLTRATEGRPGPVLLSVPADLLDEPVEVAPASQVESREQAPLQVPAVAEVEAIVDGVSPNEAAVSDAERLISGEGAPAFEAGEAASESEMTGAGSTSVEIGAPASAAPVRQGRHGPPDPSLVKAILDLLAGARRPVILAGAGVLRSRSSTALVRLAELLEVPVIAAWRRPDVFPNDHPLYLGMSGSGAAPTVLPRLLDADALLVLGCRLNEVASFEYRVPAAGTRWAHVDREPRREEAGLRAPDVALAADAGAFLAAARRRLTGAVVEAEPMDARRAGNISDRAAYEAASRVDTTPWAGPGVHPGRIVTTLQSVLPPEALLTTDAGNFGGWLARGFRFLQPGTFLGPTSGAMGYGLPAAIAAALARPGRPVVALAGDGGFAMTMAELETAVRERARVVAIVFDNERYGTIRAHQDQRANGQAVATDLGSIDFAAVARACGALGLRVESDDAFEPALRAGLAAKGPAVLHLLLDRRWQSVDRLVES